MYSRDTCHQRIKNLWSTEESIFQSIIRAALSLWSHDGEITQGGSTITQQVIKNNLLTQKQTYSRKLTEVMLAPALESKFTKADIRSFTVTVTFMVTVVMALRLQVNSILDAQPKI